MKKFPSYPMKYQHFNFKITAKELLILPVYKGSTFRGGFGYAFKRVVCAMKDKECLDCLLKEKCVYSYIFETPPPLDTKIMRKYKSVPHPFVIEPPPEKRIGYKPGDEITFSLILIGKAIDYLPYFIYTFDELGKIGLGKGRAEYEMKEVHCAGKMIYDSESKTLSSFKTSTLYLESETSNPKSKIQNLKSQITLNFLTPCRIIYDEHLIKDIEFHILIRNLLRRLSLLYYFHCNGDSSEWDFKGLIEQAKEIRVKSQNLKWYDWERYSARQDTRMKLGGFVGEVTFEGDIEPFMPLIKAGEVLHVGKGTSFGMGRYEIRG
ncbi:MAG: CRISPR system precrRNA processing endoribonuclease RAMP protein Cas6 [Nitrospirota bacterium]